MLSSLFLARPGIGHLIARSRNPQVAAVGWSGLVAAPLHADRPAAHALRMAGLVIELASTGAVSPASSNIPSLPGVSVADHVRLAAGEPCQSLAAENHAGDPHDALRMPWHLLEPEEVLLALVGPDSSAEHMRTGLSDERGVALRRRLFGSNELTQTHARSALSIILGNFFNPITFVLSCVLAIALSHEEWIDALAVVLVVVVNSGIGAAQELESEKAMSAIRKLGSTHPASVIRNGVSVDLCWECGHVRGDRGYCCSAVLEFIVGRVTASFIPALPCCSLGAAWDTVSADSTKSPPSSWLSGTWSRSARVTLSRRTSGCARSRPLRWTSPY